MEIDIMILNVIKYNVKQNNEVKTRLAYVLLNKDSNRLTEKFKGFTELAEYYDTDKAFNSIDTDMIFKKVRGFFEKKSYNNNPMKTKMFLEKIEIDGKIIDLL